jgi:hypothetical protein
LATVVRYLPVQSGERLSKAGIGGRSRKDEPTFGIDVDAGEQLLEMDIEVIGNGPGDVTFKQTISPAPATLGASDRTSPAMTEPERARLMRTAPVRCGRSRGGSRSVRHQLLAHAADQTSGIRVDLRRS